MDEDQRCGHCGHVTHNGLGRCRFCGTPFAPVEPEPDEAETPEPVSRKKKG